MALFSASVMPMTAAPSICERIRSGLAAKPQSIAVCTSGTRTVPSSSTFTRTQLAT